MPSGNLHSTKPLKFALSFHWKASIRLLLFIHS